MALALFTRMSIPPNVSAGRTVAPSAAARSAIALPMPRLAPVMKSVFPFSVDIESSPVAGGPALLPVPHPVLPVQHAGGGVGHAALRGHPSLPATARGG